MQRALEPCLTRYAIRKRHSPAATPPGAPPARSLPPTRAARPARSRGVFFDARRRSRLGSWFAKGMCAAAVILSIAASAHFALPAFEAAARNGNVGPELLATATRPPLFLVAPAR